MPLHPPIEPRVTGNLAIENPDKMHVGRFVSVGESIAKGNVGVLLEQEWKRSLVMMLPSEDCKQRAYWLENQRLFLMEA